MSRIKDFFKHNPSVDVVYETTDGYLFRDRAQASAHAQTLSVRNVLTHSKEVTTVKSEDDKQESTSVQLTAEQRIERATNAETLELLEEYAKGEKAKTVLAAIEDRKKILQSKTE